MVEHFRLDKAGCDRIDANAIGRKLLGQRSRERIDRTLGRAVNALAGDGHNGADRGNIDDNAGFLAHHLQRSLLCAVEITLDVDVEAARERILGEHQEEAVVHDARVVDQNVKSVREDLPPC